MVVSSCQHNQTKHFGKNRNGTPRIRCILCGKTWTIQPPKPLGDMRVSLDDAKQVCRLLVEGMSIRATERVTGMNRNTICKLIVLFGRACQNFMDAQMRNLKLE